MFVHFITWHCKHDDRVMYPIVKVETTERDLQKSIDAARGIAKKLFFAEFAVEVEVIELLHTRNEQFDIQTRVGPIERK